MLCFHPCLFSPGPLVKVVNLPAQCNSSAVARGSRLYCQTHLSTHKVCQTCKIIVNIVIRSPSASPLVDRPTQLNTKGIAGQSSTSASPVWGKSNNILHMSSVCTSVESPRSCQEENTPNLKHKVRKWFRHDDEPHNDDHLVLGGSQGRQEDQADGGHHEGQSCVHLQ